MINMPFKKNNLLKTEIKKEVKVDFKKKGTLDLLRKLKLEKDKTIDIKFNKMMANIAILENKLDVLYNKKLYKNLTSAKQTILRLNLVYSKNRDLFFTKLERMNVKANEIYLKNNSSNINLIIIDSFIQKYINVLNKLVRKSNDITYIEDLNPLLNQAIKDFNNIFNDKKELN